MFLAVLSLCSKLLGLPAQAMGGTVCCNGNQYAVFASCFLK